MLNNLKGELIKKNVNPVKAVMKVTGCCEKTARRKLRGESEFRVSDVVKIQKQYFEAEGFDTRWLFQRSD